MIEWERNATSHVETLVIRCDGCGVHQAASLTPEIIDHMGRDSLVDVFRDNAAIFIDVDDKDRCYKCRTRRLTELGVLLRYADGREKVLCQHVWVSTIIEPHEKGGTRRFERIDTWDECGRRVYLEVFDKTDAQLADPGSWEAEEARRTKSLFRAAMQGMANVMEGVLHVLVRIDVLVEDWAKVQQEDSYMQHLRRNKYAQPSFEKGSEEWSRRVREGVKALRPSGPVVAVQGDWEDD